MRQTSVFTDKKAQGQQLTGLLGHAAIRAHPERALAVGVDSHPHPFQQVTNAGVSTLPLHEEGHNFTNVPARAPAPGVPANYGTPACPAVPRRCPFGGACHTCHLTVQTKLKVNQPSDIYEQEADRVAEKVMRMPESSIPTTSASSTKSTPSAVPPIVHEVLRSSGHPLDAATRAFFEPRFGHDFSKVRVHTNVGAAESARAVNALAYTVGRDVVFGAGQYAPRSANGRRLLAHELTHVVQQRGPKPVSLQKQEEMEAGRDTFEEEAERVGTLVAESEMTAEEEPESESAEMAEKPSTSKSKSSKKKAPTKPKPPPNPCTRTILAEGTCADLVAGSRFICCDPDKGIERKGMKTDIDGNPCPSEKFTPIFTCDSKCDKALDKGCDDEDNWMAVPNNQFTRKQCGDIWTICANGKNTKGYVRDHSITQTRFEVSPKIQKDLGVTVGSSFKGAVYRPGAKQAAIDKDACCTS